MPLGVEYYIFQMLAMAASLKCPIFHNSNTYIYIVKTNGHYSPSVRIIDLVSHTIYVVCVNFIHKRRNLQFKVDSQRQIFWETFYGNFIYSQSFCQNLLRGNSRRNTVRILFRCLAFGTNPGFSSNNNRIRLI